MKITRAIRVSHLGDGKLMTTLLQMLTVTIDQSEGISGADIPEQAVKKMRTGSAALSLPGSRAFFAFLITFLIIHHHLGAWNRLRLMCS